MAAVHHSSNGYITTATIVDLPILGRARGNVVNTNTFLINAASTIADAGGNNITITATGAAVSTTEPFTSTYNSVLFRASTSADFLTPASNSVFNVGTGDFTTEAWVFPTANRTYSPIWDTQPTGSSGGRTNAFLGWRATDGSFQVFGAGGLQIYTGPAGQLPLSTWRHIAVTRLASRLQIFINGSSVFDSTTSALSSLNMNTTQIVIGRLSDNTPSSTNCFAGNISNFRWIKGNSQYFYPFTVPTSDLSVTPPLLNWTRNYGIRQL
jgi:hypothetical protein